MKTIAYSRKLMNALETVKTDFGAYTTAFTSLSVRRSHFAPVFLRTFKLWQLETKKSFVAFVRELDPAMPVGRAEYPNHRSYQAALYLRRLAEKPHTTARHRKTLQPYQVLTRFIKGTMPLVRDHEGMWSAVEIASGWRERDMERLKLDVGKARPIFLPGAPRLVSSRRHAATPNVHRQPRAVAADHATVQ